MGGHVQVGQGAPWRELTGLEPRDFCSRLGVRLQWGRGQQESLPPVNCIKAWLSEPQESSWGLKQSNNTVTLSENAMISFLRRKAMELVMDVVAMFLIREGRMYVTEENSVCAETYWIWLFEHVCAFVLKDILMSAMRQVASFLGKTLRNKCALCLAREGDLPESYSCDPAFTTRE